MPSIWLIINSRGFRKSEAVGAAPGIERASRERVGRDERGSTLDGPTTEEYRKGISTPFNHRDEGNHLFEGGGTQARCSILRCMGMPLQDCIRSSHTTKKLFVIQSLAAQGVEKGHKAINVNWTDVSTLHRQKP